MTMSHADRLGENIQQSELDHLNREKALQEYKIARVHFEFALVQSANLPDTELLRAAAVEVRKAFDGSHTNKTAPVENHTALLNSIAEVLMEPNNVEKVKKCESHIGNNSGSKSSLGRKILGATMIFIGAAALTAAVALTISAFAILKRPIDKSVQMVAAAFNFIISGIATLTGLPLLGGGFALFAKHKPLPKTPEQTFIATAKSYQNTHKLFTNKIVPTNTIVDSNLTPSSPKVIA